MNIDLPNRKTIRLKDYDYSQNGVYFVTICAYERQCVFGEIKNDKMIYSEFGKIALLEIKNTLMKRAKQNIHIVKYVVMPNHVHLIVFIGSQIRIIKDRQNEFAKPISNSLRSIIGGYKSAVTKNIHRIGETDMASHVPTDFKIWQPRYYEHIIRCEKAYAEIRQYIDENVLLWDKDKLNPF